MALCTVGVLVNGSDSAVSARVLRRATGRAALVVAA
jgi:hypothetical protein